ncbi:MAG TPA: NF038129 family PEP-CTERM protein [Pirellulales bacterium]|nr:NF038129 family PEP-CTERM protein [Pirellulales bacterium]
MIPAQDKAGIGASVAIAYDRSPDLYRGRVYLVYSDAAVPGGTNTNIFLRYSDDGGESWSPPVVVNDDLAPPNQVSPPVSHFLPSIAVDKATGDVAVGWYDTRNDPNNVKTQFFVATSGDGGQTFSASRPVSPGLSDATSNQLSTYARSNQYGRYSGLDIFAGVIHPAWVDDGSVLAIPGNLHFNVASATVAVADVKIPPPTLSPGQLQGTEGAAASGIVATINDPDPTATANQFTKVVISWGDGTGTTPGTVVQPGGAGTPFQVMGSHTYARPGAYPISVSLHDTASGADLTAANNISPTSFSDENSETVAVDPTNPLRIFVAANTDFAGVGLFTATSSDGGMTWTRRLLANGSDDLPPAYAYPQAVFDKSGRLFLSYIEQDHHLTAYLQSTDGGETFTLLNEGQVQGDVSNSLPSGFPRLATGPAVAAGQSALWELLKNNVAERISALPWVYSDTAATKGSAEVIPGSSGSFSFTPALAVGPAGQTLVAFQKPSGTPGADTIYTSLNTDGTTFGPSQSVVNTGVVGQYSIPAQSAAGVNSGLALAWDRRNGPNGRVYLVYVDLAAPGSTATTIKLLYSTDSGATWQGPVTVSDAPAGSSSFLPSLAVDQITGNVAVGWYDTRLYPITHAKSQFFVATSGNGGRSFSPGFAVSSDASDPAASGLSAYAQQFQYGYFTGLAYQNGIVYPAWADDSASLNTQAASPHFDVWTARLGTANIGDAVLAATGKVITPTENAQFTGTVATFADANRFAVAGDFTAVVDWGDGNTSALRGADGSIAQAGLGNFDFNVVGTHKYTDEKVYPLKVTILDTGGATAQATGSASVSDPPPQAFPKQPSLTALQGVQTGTQNIGLFTIDTDDESAAGENHTYRYSINWDDRTSPDTGTVTPQAAQIVVRAGHAFTTSGTLHPVVTLTDEHGQSGTATATAVVSSDVTTNVKTVSSGLTFNAQTNLFYGQITITNTGTNDITGPLPVVVSGLPAGVTLNNASGNDGAGNPMVTSPVTTLSPGQSTTVNVQFSNPTQSAIDYTLQVFDPAPAPAVQLVSVTDPGQVSASADSPSVLPSASADGRYVAFASRANNLLVNAAINAGPPGGIAEVYVRDTVTGKLTLASVDSTGASPANSDAGNPFISPNGRYVVFSSQAKNLATNVTTGLPEWYVHDLQTGTTTLVSADTQGQPINGFFQPSGTQPFSVDGRYLLFASDVSNLVTNDAVGGLQIFVRDLQTNTTTLVSVDAAGTDGGNSVNHSANDTSQYAYASISADGRYVAFQSVSTNLVANDAIGGTQSFVRDLQQKVTTMVSVSGDGTNGGNDPLQFNQNAERPRISADGSTVVFISDSTNLLPSGPSPSGTHLFARNLQTNTTSLVSIAPDGTTVTAGVDNGAQFDVTPDGRYIAWSNYDASLGPPKVYVRDTQAGTTVLASVNAAGSANGNHGVDIDRPEISADGRFVMFVSESTDLVNNDQAGGRQIFVRDLQQNTTTLVSANRDGSDAADNTLTGSAQVYDFDAAISSDGRFVTFEHDADNLVAADANFAMDVFQRDLQSATTQLISGRDPTLPSVSGDLPDDSRQPSISADGRYVAFTSDRLDLLPAPLNPNQQGYNVFVRDLTTGSTTLASVATDGHSSANGDTRTPVISSDGRFVLFASEATNLTSNATPAGVTQLYLRDLVLGATTLVSVNQSGAGTDNGVVPDGHTEYGGYQPSISDDGRFVTFESTSDDLTAVSTTNPNGPQVANLYVRDLLKGTTTLVSVSADGTSGANLSVQEAAISGNGRHVVFRSAASNLVAGLTTHQVYNIYVRDLQLGTTSLASVDAQGTGDGNGGNNIIAGPGAISDDGRYVTFESNSTNLTTTGQTGIGDNVFVRDMQQGVTTLVSMKPSGSTAANGSAPRLPVISANGEVVAFFADTPLVPNLANGGSTNLYVWDRQTATTTLVSYTAAGNDAAGTVPEPGAELSADGRYVLFQSAGTNLVTGSSVSGVQLYLRDVQLSTTTLVTRAPDGSGAIDNDGRTQLALPALSADGLSVAFESPARNLVADDFNDTTNIFVAKMPPPCTPSTNADAPALVTVTDPGLVSASGDAASSGASASADGRYVAFVSTANNLLVNAAINASLNGNPQIYVRDTVTRTLTLVTVDPSGTTPANGILVGRIFISPNGRYVVFESEATNLVPGATDGTGQIYVRDLQTGTTSLATADQQGKPSHDGGNLSAIRPFGADGRYLLFDSVGTDLVANDKIGGDQLFVRDLQTGTTTLVTANVAGTDGANGKIVEHPWISADGRYVAFESDATNLVTNDAVGGDQVFVRDMQQGVTTLVSVNAAGTDGGNQPLDPNSNPLNDRGEFPQISADGSTVLFESASTNLLPTDTATGSRNIFARNLRTNAITMVNIDPSGKGLPGGVSLGLPNFFGEDITADGRYVAFNYYDGIGATNENFLYVRDLQAGTTVLASVNAAGIADGNNFGASDLALPHFSADGRFVLFASASTDLVTNDHAGGLQWFVRDLQQQHTTLVSVKYDGTDAADTPPTNLADSALEFPSFSSDGRFVTFDSFADNLVASDDNFTFDVFQRDLQTATTQLVSARDPNLPSVAGSPNVNDSQYHDPSVSADGRYVAFTSERYDLLPNLIHVGFGTNEVFVRDLKTGVTTLISVGLDGSAGNGNCFFPVISANGRFVVFISEATNLTSNPPGSNAADQLYVRDLLLGTTTLVSVNLSGAGTDYGVNTGNDHATISDDGHYVVFESESDDLTAVPTTVGGVRITNVYVRDLLQGTTTLVSISADGKSGDNANASYAQISGNGRFVAFSSGFSNGPPNLVSGLSLAPNEDVYVRDLQLGTTSLVSFNTQGNGDGNDRSISGLGSISDDGRYVTFDSLATNIAPPGAKGYARENIFLRDVQQGVTTLASVAPAGANAAQSSAFTPIISADGNVVAYLADNGGLTNLWLWDRTTGDTTLVSVTTTGQPAGGVQSASQDSSIPTALSADGRFMLFQDTLASSSGTLVPGPTLAGNQLYLRDVKQGLTTLVSRSLDGSGANNENLVGGGFGSPPVLSANGSTVAFDINATNLVADDFNANLQVFAFQATTPDQSLSAVGAGVTTAEHAAFQGLLATFVDNDPMGTTCNHSAMIDWGDGSTSPGSIAADATIASQFDVTGSHTYAEEGAFAIVVTIVDQDGSTATARSTVVAQPQGGTITYRHLSFDTSALKGTNGTLALQFNPGQIPGAQPATAVVSSLAVTGGSTSGSPTTKGGASVLADGSLQLVNSGTLNELLLPLVYGNTVSFDLTLSGAAVAQPGGGSVGNTFAVQLLGADGLTPQATAEPDGAALGTNLSPNGTAATTGFLTNAAGKPLGVVPNVADVAVMGQGGLTVGATAGNTFTGQTVATFTDPGGAEPLADYSATIAWGDGSSSAGTILPADTNGTFTVQGSHTYASSGTQPIVVTLSHDTAPAATATSTADITAPSTPGITVAALATAGSESMPLSNVKVATFTVPGTTMSASDFTATIAWGDGSTTAATVAADATAGFDVTGWHTYTEEGTYTFTATVRGNGVTTGFATATAAVADPSVVSQGGFSLAATAGIAFTGLTVATFSDPSGAEGLADYSATINWGDGSSSAGSLLPVDAKGTFTVQGSHSYAAAGQDAIVVTLHHDTAPDVTATSTAVVAAATITGQNGIAATGVAVTGSERSELTGVTVATFTDSAGSLPPGDFSATINWGDGSTSAGSVSASLNGSGPSPQFTISGSHQYLDEGHFTLTVAVSQTAGPAPLAASATVTAVATVHEQPLQGVAVGTPDQKWIQEIYGDLFDRQAEPQGRDYWVGLLGQGQSRGQVAFDIVKLAYPREFQHDTVDALYAQYLGRAADAQGRDYWTAFLYDGGTIEEMSQALCSSPEFYRLHGSAAKGLIDALYQDALGRAADAAGEAHWEQQMTHGMSQASLAAAFFSSDEYLRLRAGSLYLQFLDRPADPAGAENFAQQLAHGIRDEQIIAQLISSDEYYQKPQV